MRSLILYLALLVFCPSCKKSRHGDIPFPTGTQNGLNTFGCYIDGAAFVPSTNLFGSLRPVTVHYADRSTPYYKAGFLSVQGIDARYSLESAGNVLMQKTHVFGTGEYPLYHVSNCTQPYDCDAGAYESAKLGRAYFIENGRLTITKLDTINKIISGRFFFTAKDTLGNRKEVTEGVFDTKYVN